MQDEQENKSIDREESDFEEEITVEAAPSEEPATVATTPKKSGRFIALSAVSLILAAAIVLLTYSLTFNNLKAKFDRQLTEQQKATDAISEELEQTKQELEDTKKGNSAYPELDLLRSVFYVFSYYADSFSEEDIGVALLKTFAESTGDKYAEYYTEEEYDALFQDSAGEYEGIGVSVLNSTVEYEGHEYKVFHVIAIYEDAPALESGLEVGDYIFAVKDGEDFKTLEGLGGYDKAINKIRGEAGSYAEFKVFRKAGETYDIKTFSSLRRALVKHSVDSYVTKTNPSVGVVEISEFDLTTPHQFKNAILDLQSKGVTKFVFDMRNNPGGDLKSVQGVLSYLLQPGDMILSSIDRKGNVKSTTYAEPTNYKDEYASCSVSAEEIGMFADLDMVALCNENTASAAEVFTATLRDYGLATIVGVTTFGKGIIQSYIPLSVLSNKLTGYAKMTTYAYVTKCGVPYHEIGITPGVTVELSDEAKKYSIYLLPEDVDNQLQAAIQEVLK